MFSKTIMKKLFVILFSILFSLVSCGSSSGGSSENRPFLTRISLSGNYQTTFTEGDRFNYDGLIVMAYYSDSSNKKVNDYVVDEPDMNNVGEQSVFVSYTEGEYTRKSSYKITIKEKPVTVTLTSISLSGYYQTAFMEGATFNYNGLVVTAHYSDNSSKEVTNYTVSSPDMSILGTQEVTVSYTENNITKTASYSIEINRESPPLPPEKELESISLGGDYETDFFVGDTFKYDGLKVYAYFSDIDTPEEVTDYQISTPDMTTVGSKTVTVSYTYEGVTKTAAYTITVKEKEKVLETVFNEPYLGKQVYLNHIGDIFSVWKKYQGEGVTIAVIDSAFDPYHEDFTDSNGKSKISNLSASFTYNGSIVTTNVGVNYVNDLSDSHGTFCAGVAAAAINSKGVVGVAPKANLMLLKTDKKPKSIVEAFKYAADNGAKVVTISIGSYYNYDGDLVNDGSDLGTVFDDAVSYCRNKGVVVCSAGGNGGGSTPTEYTFPGATTGVIGCGGLAFNTHEEIWEGTSYNSSKTYQFIDVLAPSENMFNICNYSSGGKQVLYDEGWNGTSFASPIVAGLAALYFEKNPSATVSQFESALYNSCHPITGSSIATKDQLGYGRVDVSKLLGMSPTGEVTLKVKSNVSSLYVYAYNSDLSLEKELKSWPGASMNKIGNIFTYTINISDYDYVLFSSGDSYKTVDLLSSSFIDGYTYDLTSIYKMNGLYVGSYVF